MGTMASGDPRARPPSNSASVTAGPPEDGRNTLTRLADLYRNGVREDMGELGVVFAGAEERRVAERMIDPAWGPRFSLGDTSATRSFLAGGAVRRLLVLVLAERLTVQAITQIRASLPGAENRLGFVSGRTERGLAFSLSKILAPPRKMGTALDVFDAAGHDLDHANADFQALRERLLAPTATKVLRCHGEGSHAKLPGLTVCGLLDPQEFPDFTGLGCARDSGRCKRAPTLPGDRVLFGGDIRARAVFFLCCNGFNFAGELYRSPVSIALSLVEGCVGTVIAPMRAVVVPDALLSWLTDRIAAGGSVGDMVAELNRHSTTLGQGTPYVLHGDPGMEIAPDPGGPVADSGRTSAVGRGGSADPTAMRALQAWLIRLRIKADRALRIVDAVQYAAPRVDAASVSTALRGVRRLTLSALKRAERTFHAGDAKTLSRDLGLLRVLTQRADAALARTVVDARRHIDPFDLSHYDLVLADRLTGPACDRCGTPLTHMVFGAGEPETETRLGVMCDVCGPKAEYRRDGLVMAGTQRFERPVPAGPVVFVQTIDLRTEDEPLVPLASISFRFFDKARDRCVGSFDEVMEVDGPSRHLKMPLPEDLSPDLHSVRVMAACGLDLAYFRCRVAGGPGLCRSADLP